ncbi:MAG: class I SAM-dependent rRNA methyltransferase [Chloroflexota bacterium]|nr:class I SAM-dependent rRNA methyltransferase [Chloroflexota bacterium]MDE2908197.1 class I SAM-dependent rRNA methyltransferase [Chloroflexota bacterium]
MIDYSRLPTAARKNISVRVKSAAERALRQGHPWVFEESIQRQSHLGNAGDLAVVYDRENNNFLAVGLYDPLSPIRIKVLQALQPMRVDRGFFAAKLREAQAKREPLINEGTTGYRLVYGESDGFPALILDRYGDTLVMKLYTTAWLPHLETLIGALEEALVFDNLVLRLSRALQSDRLNIAKLYGLEDGQQLIGAGAAETVAFVENGLLFHADVRLGHKTGFFFDQRENRQKARELAQGRRVLDVFSYTGGFSVYALAGGARAITALDSSKPALETLKRNVESNGYNTELIDAMAGDAFANLMQLTQARRKFNMVIIDPPAFANSRASMRNAVVAYRRLVEMALRLLENDGVLLMASCSSRIPAEMFFQLVERSAMVAGFKLEIIEKTGHGLDHPVGFPEAAYLKALFARVAQS